MLSKKFALKPVVATILIVCAGCGTLVPGQIFSNQSLSSTGNLNRGLSLRSDTFSGLFSPESVLDIETVPDRVAQSVFLLIISNFLEKENDRLARKYIQTMGQVDCATCIANISEQDVNNILQAARNYRSELTILDARAIQLRSANDFGQLRNLQRIKIQRIRGILAALSTSLATQSYLRLQDHVNLRIKPRLRIVRTDQVRSDVFRDNMMPEYPPPDETEMTTEMSDAWTPPEDDTQDILPEGTQQVFFQRPIVGIGVSEVDYDADFSQTQTDVSIVLGGTTLSSASASGAYRAAAETQYMYETTVSEPLPEDTPEVLYDVQSRHTYFLGPYNFFYEFTFARIGISLSFTGYQFANYGYGGCSGNAPWGYSAYCPLGSCQRARLCGGGAYPGIQGVGLEVRFWYVTLCYMSYYYTAFRPYCRNT